MSLNLSHYQTQALITLYTTGKLEGINKRTLRSLFDKECVVENAYCKNTITHEGKAYLEKILPMLKWFPQEVL
jgi:hypothetical protein